MQGTAVSRVLEGTERLRLSNKDRGCDILIYGVERGLGELGGIQRHSCPLREFCKAGVDEQASRFEIYGRKFTLMRGFTTADNI